MFLNALLSAAVLGAIFVLALVAFELGIQVQG